MADEDDIQFLMSNNFVFVDLEHLQNEKVNLIPIESSSLQIVYIDNNDDVLRQQTTQENLNFSNTNISSSSPLSLPTSVIKTVQSQQNESDMQSVKNAVELDEKNINKNKIKSKIKKVSKHKKISTLNKIKHKKEIKCNICNQLFDNLNTLKFHKQTEHTLKKPFKCEKCLKEFNFEINLIIHIASHQTDYLKCPICYLDFQRQSSFQGHLKNHMKNDNFNCNHCEEEFEYEENFKKHKINQHKKSSENNDNDNNSDNVFEVILKDVRIKL